MSKPFKWVQGPAAFNGPGHYLATDWSGAGPTRVIHADRAGQMSHSAYYAGPVVVEPPDEPEVEPPTVIRWTRGKQAFRGPGRYLRRRPDEPVENPGFDHVEEGFDMHECFMYAGPFLNEFPKTGD